MTTLLQSIRSRITPPHRERDRRLPLGINRGLTMKMDLSCRLQNYCGLAERELVPELHRLAKGARCAFDVGAADGWYSLYFLAKVGVGRLFAFEPSKEAADALLANLQANGIPPTRAELTRSFVGDGTNGTVALDSFADRISLPVCIKVDVEGAELAVLQGATRILRRRDVRWIIETHSRSAEEQCFDLLRANDYSLRVVRNAWWRAVVPEYRPLEHNRWLVAWH